MPTTITIEINQCVDKLPTILKESNPYRISEMLLVKTLYGNLITCYFFHDIQGFGRFQPIGESRPYSISEVTWWGSLEGLKDEQHGGEGKL